MLLLMKVVTSEITRDHDVVSRQLETLFPSKSLTDPIFVDVADDHIVVPQVLHQEKPKSTPGNKPSTSSTAATDEPVPTGSSHYTDEAAEFEEETVDGKFRFDWRLTLTINLLDILVEKKRKIQSNCLKLKKTWPVIAKTISKETSNNPTAGQCREKYYSLNF
uniref:Uncharacterized protein LOC111134352 n=1 Tax=Crassostrea virginica TaxID=6565 RepID=A0A8B8EH88_CRAVI|nr:uncharacterized protein LOC111134352 [Crassostrea virginica]